LMQCTGNVLKGEECLETASNIMLSWNWKHEILWIHPRIINAAAIKQLFLS
jgi:hypothetical protein